MEITRIKNLSLAFISSFALKCAVDLDISGRIQAYGRPMPLNELARSIPIPPEKDSMLGRLMALLVHQGIFAQSELGYLLTPVSELLLIEGSNMGAFVRSSTPSLVDVGGGTGTAAKIIAEAFPGLRCIVFDLPHVVTEALKNDSFDVVGGDMFEKIPPADAIFLKNVLHDWGDKDCVRILKRCKEAIESRTNNGGKVIVVDIIIDLESDNSEAVETSLLFDINMMCLFGSKERKKQEWHDIIMEAGYSGYKIYPARLGVDAVLELFP